MKTIVKILGLFLILSSCTTRQGKENLYVPWYQFSLLAADSTGKLDTVYMDDVTATNLAEFPLATGDIIEVQKTSIGYVYSSHDYVSKDILKTYFGIWKERYTKLLPIEKKKFQKILKGTQPRDPYIRMMEEEMKTMRPR